MSFGGYSEVFYDLGGVDGNTFYVTAHIEPVFLTDERWLVQDGQLYFLHDNPLEKVK